MRKKRMDADAGLGRDVKIELGSLVFEMDRVIRLDSDGAQRVPRAGEANGEIIAEPNDGQKKDGAEGPASQGGQHHI